VSDGVLAVCCSVPAVLPVSDGVLAVCCSVPAVLPVSDGVLAVCCSVPAVLPQVIVSAAGSSSLKVEWTALHPDQARGIITHHQLIYRQHGGLTQHTVDLAGDVHEHIITGTTLLLLLPINDHLSR